MRKQNVAVLVIITVIIIGVISLFSLKFESITVFPEAENLASIDPNQNMVTKEFKIFNDFIYDIGPRFGAIKKSDISNINSIKAFLDDDIMQNMVNLKSTSLILVKEDKPSEIRINGNTMTLNNAQLEFLRTSQYSTNFGIRVEYEEKDPLSGITFDSYREPYMTIVPEQQAQYTEGKDALKLFLKDNCQSVLIGVDPQKLKPAKLYFTVTKTGKIEDIKLDRDSGYPEVDKKMIELLKRLPGEWVPAKNLKSENVNQELVVSFGLMGC